MQGNITFTQASTPASAVADANQGLRVNAGFVQLGDPIGDPVTNPMVRRFVEVQDSGDTFQFAWQNTGIQGIYVNDGSQFNLSAAVGFSSLDLVDGSSLMGAQLRNDGARIFVGDQVLNAVFPANPPGTIPQTPVIITGDVCQRRFSILGTGGNTTIDREFGSVSFHMDHSQEGDFYITNEGGAELGTTRHFFGCNNGGTEEFEVYASGGEQILWLDGNSYTGVGLNGQDGFFTMEKTVNGWRAIACYPAPASWNVYP